MGVCEICEKEPATIELTCKTYVLDFKLVTKKAVSNG